MKDGGLVLWWNERRKEDDVKAVIKSILLETTDETLKLAVIVTEPDKDNQIQQEWIMELKKGDRSTSNYENKWDVGLFTLSDKW